MADLEVLLKQRQTAKANITRIKNLVSESLSAAELECRLGLVEAYFKQILTIQNEIEDKNPKDSGRADLEDLCIKTKMKIIELLGDNYKRGGFESSFAIPIPATSKLPTLDLPKFDGKYSAYKNFISSFKQFVDNDTSLSPIEKFNHLIHCLSGQALDTVRAFQITSDNYKKALNRLEQRYDNTTLIFLEHISNLYDLPDVQKPSAVKLRSLVDSASAIYSSLKSLGNEEQICHAMLIHLISTKVDVETRIKWKENLDFDKLPSWDTFCKSLERRCQFLESTESYITTSNNNNNRRNGSKVQTRLSLHTQQKCCALCKCLDHWISSCAKYIAMDHDLRRNTVKKLGLCLNCLGEGHVVSKCLSKATCKTCRKTHHTTLHRTTIVSNVEAPSTSQSGTTPSVAVNTHIQPSTNVILATAVVLVRDGSGEFQLCRALLDSGSQVNLITETLARQLNLTKRKKMIDIVGVGGVSSKMKYEVVTSVRSRYNEEEYVIDLLVMNRIAGYQPTLDINTRGWNLPTPMDLADEHFYQSQRIDLLLGAESFFEVLRPGRIKLGLSLPILQETSFGWVISGSYRPITQYDGSRTVLHTCNENNFDENLHMQMEFLWSLEQVEYKSQKKYTEEQEACESSFLKHVEQLDNGRIQIMLPFKESTSLLGSSYNVALKRLTNLEKRLAHDVALKEQYIAFMREYEQLGHMTLVENVNLSQQQFFIPHHCVVKPSSTSTKLRVVFDASAKTSSGISLNDVLHVGPTIQDELFLHLIRFRLNMYAFTADIIKKYRMIMVHPSHRKFQQILWREHEDEPIRIYQLNTITYGMASSPFLAIRALHYVADKYKEEFPVGAHIIKTNFYVDDLLAGADDYEKLSRNINEVKFILRKTGFELAKMQSNHPSLKSEAFEMKNININEPNLNSALGILWDSNQDSMLFSFQPKKRYAAVTKRSVLSLSSSIFDPIGLICPILIQQRVLLQDLWIQKIDWDSPLPQKATISFQNFVNDLENLRLLKIPRYVLASSPSSVQLHGFCDASIRAYGCCVYVRVVDTNGNTYVNLLTAKCRVAPTKKRTLPQLELCSAHLLAKLYNKIVIEFQFYNFSTILWSDSSVVLQWLQMHSSTLNIFVGNRISEIQELTTNCKWRHVPTNSNPADIVSRGCVVSDLLNSSWFTGPKFLAKSETEWPAATFLYNDNRTEIESAIRKTILPCTKIENAIIDLLERISSYEKILRVVCWLRRFCLKEKPQSYGPITVEERKHGLHVIVWNLQQQHFFYEFRCIDKGETIKSSLRTLGLFIENVGNVRLIRVGGRLQHASIPNDSKHPFLLPKRSNFVNVLVHHIHVSNYHAGPKALITFIRQSFWIVGARSIARKIVNSCPSCIRYRPKLLQQIMGDLPRERVTPARPFERCGVDFCGPINTYLRIRGKQPYKTYIAIFVCFVTKAVHIETVTDLSTEAFFAALKRFIGRRGVPSDIFCDNATNFIGKNNHLKDLQATFANKAPHFGGIWEAAVKSAKGHLYRTLANAMKN
ncbi:uncharacterized protein LOC142231101 [Haematobia irritans]|uniref:uncharacterized protein LOC142231101 n=1 Tax=Haematobia irritans TaxID=7368 RepID=UPI003F4FAC44